MAAQPGGKVLESIDQIQAAEYLLLENIEIEPPAVSGWLTVAEGGPLTEDRLVELMEEMDARGMLTRADSIDAGDPDKLVIDYDGRFRVELGYDAERGAIVRSGPVLVSVFDKPEA